MLSYTVAHGPGTPQGALPPRVPSTTVEMVVQRNRGRDDCILCLRAFVCTTHSNPMREVLGVLFVVYRLPFDILNETREYSSALTARIMRRPLFIPRKRGRKLMFSHSE